MSRPYNKYDKKRWIKKIAELRNLYIDNEHINIKCEGDHKRETHYQEIHHVDGNPRNNNIENLKLLCKNCHRKAHKILRGKL